MDIKFTGCTLESNDRGAIVLNFPMMRAGFLDVPEGGFRVRYEDGTTREMTREEEVLLDEAFVEFRAQMIVRALAEYVYLR